jgi:hypothetical protein
MVRPLTKRQSAATGTKRAHIMSEVSIEPFTRAHLDGLIALMTAEGWSVYTTDAERTYRAMTAFRLRREDLGLRR